MKPRVLLINSPTMGDQSIGIDNYFPLGLLYLASVLDKGDIADVKIEDISNHFYPNHQNDYGWRQSGKERQSRNNHLLVNEISVSDYFNRTLIPIINDFQPSIIGFGALFSGAFKGLRFLAEKVKQHYPNIPIIIGGITSTTFAPEILRKYPFIDYVVLGEGEDSLVEFVKRYQHKSSMAPIDGFAFRENGQIFLNPKTKFIFDLDRLPFPNYRLLNDIREYRMDTTGWYSPKKLVVGQPFPLLTSRSCPRQCTFCNMHLVHGKGIRYRSPNNVLDEMEILHKEYGVTYFNFIDDNLTYDGERMLEICRGILARNINIQFDTANGASVSSLDETLVDAMVEAGLVHISLAIESGSAFIRNKVMKKGLKNEKIYEVVEALKKHPHVLIKGLFIIGMPPETHETLEETFTMIQQLSLDKIGIFFATPYPGTELFAFCKENRLLEYNPEEMLDIADFQHEASRPHFKPFQLEKEELVAFQNKCYEHVNTVRKQKAGHLPRNYPLRFKGACPG